VGDVELTDLVARHAAARRVPGTAFGLLRNGSTTTAYVGVADVRTAQPVSAATRFGIGSLTKSMVAAAVAILAAERRLSFDDPVATHVPELRRCGWAQEATLRDLMANRSPVPLLSSLEFGFDEHADGDDRALARLVAELADRAPAGRHWSYANLGWCVLGRAIETVTGGAWEDAMPRLLAPVGLSGTTWTTGEDLARAVGHDESGDGPVPVEPLLSRAYSPAGSTIVSTLEDMLRFAAWHLAHPVAAPLRVVHSDVSIHGWLDGWGLGLGRFDWGGVEVWGWDGVASGQRSVLRLLHDRSAAFVLLSNGRAGRALAFSILADIVPEVCGIGYAGPSLEPSPDAPDRFTAYAGTYGWPDRRVEVTATSRGLQVIEDGVGRPAVPLDRRTFLVDRDDPDVPTITFADFDASGRPGVLYDMVWGLPRLSGG
jgi:CubicO group peptidase (beta-lactamase class C family)